MTQTAYVALHPPTGLAAGLVSDPPTIEVGPRRWGRRVLGEEQVCLTAPWAGYRWGPVGLHGMSPLSEVVPRRCSDVRSPSRSGGRWSS